MNRTSLNKLLDDLTAIENNLPQKRLLAPCVIGGRVRVKIAGLVYTFIPRPNNFAGWGIFRPIDEKCAELVESASLPQIIDYLQRLPTLRLFLVEKIKEQTWFGFPVNIADARQRFDITTASTQKFLHAKTFVSIPIHLVNEGNIFETVIARSDGKTWWFDSVDRRSDIMLADKLRQALQSITLPVDLKIPNLTPELRTAYQLATQQATEFESYYQKQRQVSEVQRKTRYAEQRLRSALTLGSGKLQGFQDKGDYWLVSFSTSTGYEHTSAIAKKDLTVISAGICLDERDRDFDLQSLVGVIEGME
jgi:hypothetical protein